MREWGRVKREARYEVCGCGVWGTLRELEVHGVRCEVEGKRWRCGGSEA